MKPKSSKKPEHAPSEGISVFVAGDDARQNCEYDGLKEDNSSSHKRENICSRFPKTERAD